MPRHQADPFKNATLIAEQKVRQSRTLQAETARSMVLWLIRKISPGTHRNRSTVSENAKA